MKTTMLLPLPSAEILDRNTYIEWTEDDFLLNLTEWIDIARIALNGDLPIEDDPAWTECLDHSDTLDTRTMNLMIEIVRQQMFNPEYDLNQCIDAVLEYIEGYGLIGKFSLAEDLGGLGSRRKALGMTIERYSIIGTTTLKYDVWLPMTGMLASSMTYFGDQLHGRLGSFYEYPESLPAGISQHDHALAAIERNFSEICPPSCDLDNTLANRPLEDRGLRGWFEIEIESYRDIAALLRCDAEYERGIA